MNYRPSPDELDERLREIQKALDACNDGEAPIMNTLQRIHDASDLDRPYYPAGDKA